MDSGRYAVSARGFNGRFSNKLQVLVDGRSIYSPFFSGTMWEHDPVPLNDELVRAAKLCAQAKGAVTTMFQEARLGKAVFLPQDPQIVGALGAALFARQDVALARDTSC